MAHNRVLLKGDPVHQERLAAGTITPGMLVELTSADRVQVNSSAAEVNPMLYFAEEDSHQGNEVDVDYLINVLVRFITGQSGNEVEAIASEAIVVGEFVESAGNGKLRGGTSADAHIGVAKSAASGDDIRFVVELR